LVNDKERFVSVKTQIALAIYAAVSVLLGLLACSMLFGRAKRPKAAALAAVMLFGGPLATYLHLSFQTNQGAMQFEEDVAYVNELCTKFGGDKIYKTVDNVAGVYQMNALNLDPDGQWASQEGVNEPWALAFGAAPDDAWLGVGGKGYWFVEQPGGARASPPYRRRVLAATGRMSITKSADSLVSAGGVLLGRKELRVAVLKSRYGYSTEDLTTPELRKRWIGGGRLKIIDLRTKETLAERVGYYRASGSQYRLAWTAGVGCTRNKLTFLPAFIQSVLRPPDALPTEKQLSEINGSE
jgi:hypothetical protein